MLPMSRTIKVSEEAYQEILDEQVRRLSNRESRTQVKEIASDLILGKKATKPTKQPLEVKINE